MTQLSILEFPDARLRTIAKPVAEVTDETRRIIDDMFETMYAAPGIGFGAAAAVTPPPPAAGDAVGAKTPPPPAADDAVGANTPPPPAAGAVGANTPPPGPCARATT